MPPSTSGRYQSRLFNFIHQQSRRLRENLGSAFRHLKVTASWGVQIALHPLHLLLQSNKIVEKPLHSSVQQNWLHLQADNIDSQGQTYSSTADIPIQRVLLLIDALPVGEIVSQDTVRDTKRPFYKPFLKWFVSPGPLHATGPVSTPSLLSRNRPIVRGIATQLSTHTLVLVTDQNQILDILTPQQQQKLQERIIGEVADYWRYQRLAHQNRSEPSLSSTETAEQLGNTLSAELPRRPLLGPWLQTSGSRLPPLDLTFTELESKYLAPMSEVAITLGKRSWELVLVKTQLIALDSSKTDAFKIQALIWAAIDYFFGHRSGKQLGQPTAPIDYLELTAGSKPLRKPLPSRHSSLLEKEFSRQLPPQLLNSDPDPWLTLSDLFGPESESEPSTQSMPPPASQTTTHLAGQKNLALPFRKATWYSLRNLLNPFQMFLPQQEQGSGGIVRQVGKICDQPLDQSTQLEPAPKWIETHAIAMGYVKHPLEQLLEWLDRAMLWLEDFLVRVLQWIQQLWQVR